MMSPRVVLLVCVLLGVASAVWMDSTVSYSFDGSKDSAFTLFSNLCEHPKWAPWLQKVTMDQHTGISNWTLQYLGLRYSWQAQNIKVEPPNIIQWESISGLPNKGKVEFFSKEEFEAQETELADKVAGYKRYRADDIKELTVRLTVSYDLPDAAAFVLRALGSVANSFINHMLVSDLKRFHKVLVEQAPVDEKVEL